MLDASGTTTYSYDAVGNLAGYAYPNGVSATYGYDTLNRLTSMQSLCGAAAPGCGPANTPIASYTYTLGPTGNRQSVAELSGRTVTYGYDDLYRLTSETVASDPGGNNGQVTYTFDSVGNRLQRNSTLPTVVATGLLNYDANDRVSTDSFDANGNTTFNSGQTNVYDFENRLVQRGGAKIVYDGDGNRVKETVATATTSYLVADQNPTGYAQVLDEIQNGVVSRTYSIGLSPISQRLTANGQGPSFYGYDGHGSVRFLTDSTGAITDTYDYDAFGNLISSTGTTPNNYLFAGEQFDSALGIYYNRARYYDQRQGRFWTMDTYEGSLREPLSLHKYLYVAANPADLVDPSGRDFDLSSLATAGAAFTTLASTALVTLQNVSGAIYLNLYKAPEILENANNYLTIGLGTFETLRMLGTNVLNYAETYSRGPVIRGNQFEEAAGANLGRTFPAIDYYDANSGVAVQIRSTTQIQSPEALFLPWFGELLIASIICQQS